MAGDKIKKMIQENTKLLLNLLERVGGYANIVSEYTGESLSSICLYLDARERLLLEEEKYYGEVEQSKVKKQLEDFAHEEFSDEMRREMRRAYLLGAIRKKKVEYSRTRSQQTLRELRRLVMEARIFVGKSIGFSPEVIARAREYPLVELIETRKGFARCPFHQERTPSFCIKNNFYYCFGCEESGDAIDLYMKLKNVSFPRAVFALIGE
jgi:hypothetical protein